MELWMFLDQTQCEIFLAVRTNDVRSLRAVLERAVATATGPIWDYACENRSRKEKARAFLERPVSVARNLTFLHLALALEHGEVVDELVRSGCRPEALDQPRMNPVYARKLCPWSTKSGDPSQVIRLSEKTNLPIPLACALSIQSCKITKRFREFCKTPGRVRCDAVTLTRMDQCQGTKYFLDKRPEDVLPLLCVRCYSHEEHLSKKLFLLVALTYILHQSASLSLGMIAGALLQNGVSAIGLTRAAMATIVKVCRAITARHDNELTGAISGRVSSGFISWLEVSLLQHILLFRSFMCRPCTQVIGLSLEFFPTLELQYSEFIASLRKRVVPNFVLPEDAWMVLASLLPVVLRFCAASGNRDDALSQSLLASANLPWLTSLSQIPYADGKLHDGPTCSYAELTAEQRQVSLSMCFRSGGVLETLQSLSRDIILSSLLHHDDVIASVEMLPLPTMMKDFLLDY